MEDRNIFYPNKLTADDIDKLSGWQLKVATLHFSPKRTDCVSLGYGYEYKQKTHDNKPQIYLSADRSEIYSHEISLEDEIDWDDPTAILDELDLSLTELIKNRLKSEISD